MVYNKKVRKRDIGDMFSAGGNKTYAQDDSIQVISAAGAMQRSGKVDGQASVSAPLFYGRRDV